MLWLVVREGVSDKVTGTETGAIHRVDRRMFQTEATARAKALWLEQHGCALGKRKVTVAGTE